jgi:DNA-binding XRE family transcriptional regulator
MTRTLNEVIKGLPPDQQQEIEAQATHLIEEEMTLRDLRKAHELTQERMAETLRISQDGVSRIEKRSDFLLSTLRSYVEAMGGKLRLIAEFPDRKPVMLSDFKSLGAHATRDRKTVPSRTGGKPGERPKKKPHVADVA